MRLDKLTSKFQMALQDAQSLAIGHDNQFIEPVHLMIALLDQEGGTVRPLLTKAGANVNLLRSQLGVLVDKLPKVEGAGGDVLVGRDQAINKGGAAGRNGEGRAVRLKHRLDSTGDGRHKIVGR